MTMDSGSFEFVMFGLTMALLSNLSRSKTWRSVVLAFASAAFLKMLASSGGALLPLAAFLALGYVGLTLVKFIGSKCLPWSVMGLLLAFAWLKKYTFLPSATFLQFSYLTLGLSYVFFRVLHLTIDMADEEDAVLLRPFDYLLYTCNFTTFISGPIQRHEEFARDQYAISPLLLDLRTVAAQLERIVLGLFKVNVLAMILHIFQEDALAEMIHPLPMATKVFAAMTLAGIYPFFLYTNFSGYIDIVIGLARLLRLRLPENFDRPFSASSFLDFWNRWHITLSTWLKNYVYNPLLIRLMRRFQSPSLQPFLGVVCFFITFFLVGIWHGRTSEFAFFGLLQGVGVASNKLWQILLTEVLGRKGYLTLSGNKFYGAFGRGLTFCWFAFSLFWFWADWHQLQEIAAAISVTEWAGVWFALCLIATVTLSAWESARSVLLEARPSATPILLNRYARVACTATLGLAVFVVANLLNQPAPDIVYKGF